MPPKKIRVEINITMRCNAAVTCFRCDRGITEIRGRTDDMTTDQVANFVEEAIRRKDEVRIERLKVLGGEPLSHPAFADIFDILAKGLDAGAFGFIKINTNAIKEYPQYVNRRGVKISRSPLEGKRHLPMYAHPADLGLPSYGHTAASGPVCGHPQKCGFSLDYKGWLPCSPAILIAAGFDLEHLYRQEIPVEPWGIELCAACVYSLPHGFRKANLGTTHVEATPRWKAALENVAAKSGHKLVLPSERKSFDRMPMVSLPVVVE